ncbi:hypothetical protein ACRRTK_019581 [Alexandromys fortis]
MLDSLLILTDRELLWTEKCYPREGVQDRGALRALPTRNQPAALPPTERSLRRDQRRPAPVQPATHSGPTQDRPETHAGPAPPRQQRFAASRHLALRAPRDTGATAVWPALDRDAPRRPERESRPVGTRGVRGGVRVAGSWETEARTPCAVPAGHHHRRIGTRVAIAFLRLERLAGLRIGPGCSRRARCSAQGRKRQHCLSREVPHHAGLGGTRGPGRSKRDCDVLPVVLC